MRRLLVDLNVVLDVLLDREPHAAASAALWAAVEEGRVGGLVPAHGVTTIFYLVAKERDRTDARRVVSDLLAVFGVAAVDEAVLRRAAALEMPDFEDAVAAAAAEAAGCDAIVTRDPAGFGGSPVEAIEPLLALAALESEVHEAAAVYGRRRAAHSM
ncbi:MAG TPA: PIN domain-containing protein [Thermoanaerobaculia bacterium]|nr:PIN domain-containing protein [Thermoanaerobaculia bacterium]